MKLYTREDYKKMKPKDLGEGDCAFCNNDEEYVLFKWTHFYVAHNKFPYAWMRKHIMAIPYEHIRTNVELTEEHLASLKEIYEFVNEYYGNEDYFSFTRESNSAWARSLAHLHIHFIPGLLYPSPIEQMLEDQGIAEKYRAI